MLNNNNKKETMQTIKCVAVGDGTVGKTCMLSSYVNGTTPLEYIPTIFDRSATSIEIDGRKIRLELWDTAGQECYDRLRPLSYVNADVLLVCFSIASPDSFKNIKNKWISEIKHFCPRSKIVLIGTKCDLRDDFRKLQIMEEKLIFYSDGIMLAYKIGAFKYLECSAITQVGLSEIMYAAAESVLCSDKTINAKKNICPIL